MARTGVTYNDITKAAESIKSRGQEPTVDRVREHLGTGSKSTIAPLLKRWRSSNGDPASIEGLPNDLVEVVKSLHDRVQQMAEHKVELARTEFNSITEGLQQELTEARNSITQLTSRQKEQEQQLQTTQEHNQALSQSLEESRIDAAKYEFQRNETKVRVTELKMTIEELRQESRDVREHFEHYQQRTAEDRQQERDQFRLSNQQLQTQTQRLTDQLSKAEAQISAQIKERAGDLKTIEDLSAKLRSSQQQEATKDKEFDVLNDRYQAEAKKNNKLEGQIDELQQRLNSLIGLHSVADKEVEVLKHSLEQIEMELQETKDKNTLLTDENKVILQEKAVLQGQFKQLQSSL